MQNAKFKGMKIGNAKRQRKSSLAQAAKQTCLKAEKTKGRTSACLTGDRPTATAEGTSERRGCHNPRETKFHFAAKQNLPPWQRIYNACLIICKQNIETLWKQMSKRNNVPLLLNHNDKTIAYCIHSTAFTGVTQSLEEFGLNSSSLHLLILLSWGFGGKKSQMKKPPQHLRWWRSRLGFAMQYNCVTKWIWHPLPRREGMVDSNKL